MHQHCLVPPILGAANQPILGHTAPEVVWSAETPLGV